MLPPIGITADDEREGSFSVRVHRHAYPAQFPNRRTSSSTPRHQLSLRQCYPAPKANTLPL
ncbi:hypothetical protein PsYK624_101610 [Phanerochaete sordida]|uniref:Uncharacterized protein n=1 Tax=Phanerochaete sordida TaxID=48140 RepID=A0A9P3GI20_9APHY|nr:hypothetical protein PsYK624_101610 [Phanerochaete sordida]